MSFLDDFRKFAFRGNVVDLSVGVIVGAAFSKIISALVGDIIMPSVSLVMPGGDWRSYGIVLRQAADPKDNVVLKYGDFLGAVVDFAIVTFVLFLVVTRFVKAAENRLVHKEALAPATKPCPFCCEALPIAATRCKACTSVLVDAKG